MVDISAKEAAARLQMDDMRVQEIERQMASVASALEGIAATKSTLESLPAKGGSTFVPIGSGLYMPAESGSKDKFLIDVGAGSIVEKSKEEALELLSTREKQLNLALGQLRASAEKVVKESSLLRSKLQSYYQERQPQQGGDTAILG